VIFCKGYDADMTFLKQNWIKVTISTTILIGVLVFGKSYFTSSHIVSTPTPDSVAHSKTDLCKVGAFFSPLPDEVNFNKEVLQDKFVQYLRASLNNWLSGKYGSATNPKTSYECPHTGLLDGKQCPDSAFDEGDYENGLSKINQDYLKSKFIVLQTDIAPGGGVSIILMFKDKPDKVFYAWVYRYRGVDEVIRGFDLRAFNEYDLTGNDAPGVEETQKMFINQLCSDNFGI